MRKANLTVPGLLGVETEKGLARPSRTSSFRWGAFSLFQVLAPPGRRGSGHQPSPRSASRSIAGRRQVRLRLSSAPRSRMEIQDGEAGKHNDLGSSGERQALHQLQPLARAATPGRSTGHRRGRLGRGARRVHRRALAPQLARRALGLWSVAAVDGLTTGPCRRALRLSRRPPHPPNSRNHHNTRISFATRSFLALESKNTNTCPPRNHPPRSAQTIPAPRLQHGRARTQADGNTVLAASQK